MRGLPTIEFPPHLLLNDRCVKGVKRVKARHETRAGLRFPRGPEPAGAQRSPQSPPQPPAGSAVERRATGPRLPARQPMNMRTKAKAMEMPAPQKKPCCMIWKKDGDS